MKSRASLVWSLSLLFCSTSLLGLDYASQELGFKARLPDRLDDLSKVMRIETLVSIGKLNESKTGVDKLISIQDLGGAIGREDLSKRAGKPVTATLEKAPWKSFQVDVFRIVETVGTASLVTFNAQVPLKPHAIQLTVCGPAKDETELRKEMQTILASIEGPSNWLTSEERIARGASGLGRLIVVGSLLVIVVVVGVRKLSRGQKIG